MNSRVFKIRKDKLLFKTKILTVALFLMFLNAICQSNKDSLFYSINGYQAVQKDSIYLILEAYDAVDRTKKLKGFYHVNNLSYFDIFGTNTILKNLVPGNSFTLKAGSFSNKWSDEISLFLKPGDSAVVKFYLTPETEGLHTEP